MAGFQKSKYPLCEQFSILTNNFLLGIDYDYNCVILSIYPVFREAIIPCLDHCTFFYRILLIVSHPEIVK